MIDEKDEEPKQPTLADRYAEFISKQMKDLQHSTTNTYEPPHKSEEDKQD
jgi:hypothetical protein